MTKAVLRRRVNRRERVNRRVRRPDKPKYATPREEWTIVVEPEEGRQYSSGRVGTLLAVFERRMLDKNAQLKAQDEPLMVPEELIAGRLYTGPMFGALRRGRPAHMR